MYTLRNVYDFSHKDAKFVMDKFDKGDNYKKQFPIPKKIIATGDFHGDLEACRVCFEDLAKVLKVNKDNYKNFIQEEDYTKYNSYQLFDKWTGGNTYVVLLGDMIDRKRLNSVEKDKKTPGEVRDEEEKLLIFINQASKLAEKKDGKVIKCLGNHEIINLFGNDYKQSVAAYTSSYSLGNFCLRDEKCNKNSLVNSKIKLFHPKGDIGKLIGENNIYGIVRIGNWIFMHGGLSLRLLEQLKRQHGINTKDTIFVANDIASNIFDNKSNISNKKKLLFRLYQDAKNAIVWNREHSTPSQKANCTNLRNIFRLLEMNENDSYMVVAHTPQFIREQVKGHVYTRNKPIKDGKRLIYSGVGKEPTGYLYEHGINFDCPNENNTNGHVWRLDVGMSRAFDVKNMEYEKDFKKLLFARRPQLLEINTKDNSTRVIVANEGLERYNSTGQRINDITML